MDSRRLRRQRGTGSQFKSAAGSDGDGLAELRTSYPTFIAPLLLGPHSVNEALIAFVLKQVSFQQQQGFVKDAARILGVEAARLSKRPTPRSDDEPESLADFLQPPDESSPTFLPGLQMADDSPPVRRRPRPPRCGEIGTMIEREMRRHFDDDRVETAIEELLVELVKTLPEVDEEIFSSKTLDELCDAFTLGPLERSIILFLLAYRRSPRFEQFCDAHAVSDWPQLMATCCNGTTERVRDALAEEAPLRAHGLVYRHDEDFPPYFALTPPVVDFLSGLAERPLADLFVRIDAEPVFDLDSFLVPPMPRALLESFLTKDRPCHILLHGQAGTGKTEFARSLVRKTGKGIFFVLPGEEGNASERRIALAGGARMARPDEAVLIIDEADTLLNTDHPFRRTSVDKGWVNMFMDQSPAIVVWITNETGAIPTSIRRRFSYALEFKSLGRQQRLAMWNRLLTDSPLDDLVDEAMRRRFSATFKVDAAGISGAIADVDRLLSRSTRTPEAAETMFDEVLSCHQELVTGHPPQPAIDVTSNYRPEALNISVDRGNLEFSLLMAADQREQGAEDARVNLLFWGPPGTGKTEYAKHLAHSLGLNLIVKSASDLLNMYVGNTEKLIRQAFEEAEAEGAILFIDEADTFFTERATASRSWEVSQTNEFLQQMEKHQGILICCTNFLHGLDKAALRRFDWKVEFQPLAPQSLVDTYTKYFGEGRPALTKGELRQLSAIEGATFGDLRAVAGRFRFVESKDLPHTRLIEALLQEIAYRKGGSGKRLGFA